MRWGGRKTRVEDCLALSVGPMLRTGMLIPGGLKNGTVHWQRSGSWMHYQSLLKEDGTGGLRLMWARIDGDGKPVPLDCWVMLRSTPQPFGGRRWWFVCPISGRLVGHVFLPARAMRFASQKALGLSYACQSESTKGRSIRKAWKLRDAIGAGGIGEAVPKPKWMRLKTFDRLEAKVQAADAGSLARLAAGLSRWDRSRRILR